MRPRAFAAFMASRTRWRMTLRSISANAAWICRKARRARDLVSMGELRALKPMRPRSAVRLSGGEAPREHT